MRNLEFTEINSKTWEEIENLRPQYKYCVTYRDHYRGNSCGEVYARVCEIPDYSKFNIERPVYKVVLTNDDVPGIIARRADLIKRINLKKYEQEHVFIPFRPACDGRATERTQPKAFAEFRKTRADGQKKINELEREIKELEKELSLEMYYSTNLYIEK